MQSDELEPDTSVRKVTIVNRFSDFRYSAGAESRKTAPVVAKKADDDLVPTVAATATVAAADPSLTDDQQEAFRFVTTHLTGQQPVLLQGSAGTGKTTLTRKICDHYVRHCGMNVVAIAPTHKAKKVIARMLNRGAFLPVTAMTMASALGKIKEHSYVGTKTFNRGNTQKLSSFGLFLVDEVSMVHDEDLRTLLRFVRTHCKRILIIGDSNQIPCPSAGYIVDRVVQKADSFVFSDPSILRVALTKVVRQAEASPILRLACYLRDHLLEDLPFERTIEDTQCHGCVIDYADVCRLFSEHYRADCPTSCRIIAYTNSAVQTHNREVRAFWAREDPRWEAPLVVGELITGYTNLGFPELIIENSEDYYVRGLQPTDSHQIEAFGGLHGLLVDLAVADTGVKVRRLFVIQVNHPCNADFLHHLVRLAERVNQRGSTKTDFASYMRVKNQVLFMEDIYHYEGTVYTEHSFKETHPLLMTRLNDCLQPVSALAAMATAIPGTAPEGAEEVNGQRYRLLHNQYTDKVYTQYPGLVEERLRDKMKAVGDSETLADRFKTMEKDVFYGYALTAHKSQGSTYDAAIADETDFQKIANRWNYRYNKMEMRVKEKNQLRYVAYTRSKDHLFLAYSRPEEKGGSDGEGEHDGWDDAYEAWREE